MGLAPRWQQLSAGQPSCASGARLIDDIEVDSAATVALQGPVFGSTAGNHAQHGEFGLAVRAIGSDLRRRGSFASGDDSDDGVADQAETWADDIVLPLRCRNRSICVFASVIAASRSDHAKPMSSVGNEMPSMTTGL
ncbi:hypothetical protein UP09_17005 [Bradyrhizobium sp. LTSP885]|nr:hypothetical protein UP09_17005 [Bradyrhizobium sp. LTSP885]